MSSGLSARFVRLTMDIPWTHSDILSSIYLSRWLRTDIFNTMVTEFAPQALNALRRGEDWGTRYHL